MASVGPPINDGKRVKVYELRNNDWFDRGTGFCSGHIVSEESKIYVESEDQPERMLLETKISKDDGYQKQQGGNATSGQKINNWLTRGADTLIIWTEPNGMDMALSFQEAEGCAAIWDFVSKVQQQLLSLGGPDDALSDDAMDTFANPVLLPHPDMGNLQEILNITMSASTSPPGRDSLSKFVLREEYIRKLTSLLEEAEDLEALTELHTLCKIMKLLILLNDSAIIEHVVQDNVVMGVVGILEYDPDFPRHKANHRRYLKNRSRFKEVVPIDDDAIRRKIHSTWRLQYLKDVILARVLDDPTFSVLNSLIFFNQVDIISHLQQNTLFLEELFGIIDSPETEFRRKKDAIGFIQQCCAVAKGLQTPARAQLYSHFNQHNLMRVITFAYQNKDAAVRVAGADILAALLEHDPAMMRSYVFKAINEKRTPLTDTLIEVLLVEVDLGVKAQAADAIKVLLDPQINPPQQETVPRTNGDFLSKLRNNGNSHIESVIQSFYDESAKKLFQPLKNLEKRTSLYDLTFQEISLFTHLVEILQYFIRQHTFRSRFFVLTENLAARVAQLLSCPQKHMKLMALKFFRQCVALGDDHYMRQLIQNHLFEPILNIVYDTMPRDNLLNSACLELFEFVKRENIKPVILHVVENYRQRLQGITYVDTFQNLITRYDQMQGFNGEVDTTLFPQEDDSYPNRTSRNGNTRWQGLRETDAAEEEYFNTSDDEDDIASKKFAPTLPSTNGASSLIKPLVDYPDDDEDTMDTENTPPAPTSLPVDGPAPPTTVSPEPIPQTPPERLSEKRRREEDEEEDELGKLSITKRRSSSVSSTTSANANILRRNKGFTNGRDSPQGKKIEISLALKAIETKRKGDDGG